MCAYSNLRNSRSERLQWQNEDCLQVGLGTVRLVLVNPSSKRKLPLRPKFFLNQF